VPHRAARVSVPCTVVRRSAPQPTRYGAAAMADEPDPDIPDDEPPDDDESDDDARIDEAERESFPASDPPSYWAGRD